MLEHFFDDIHFIRLSIKVKNKNSLLNEMISQRIQGFKNNTVIIHIS